jgi:DNA-binding beta-propeller fold protein YncE
MRTKRSVHLLLFVLALCLCLGASSAQAQRTLLTEEALKVDDSDPEKPIPAPDGEIEGACGLAIDLSGKLYVSDYYHGLIYTYNPPGHFPSERYAYNASTSAGLEPEGPCQIAISLSGALYVNIWHQSVLRLQPSLQTFDIANSTGVAVDLEGRVYVNDRTHVNVYDSAGAFIEEIGAGNLKDAYGLAVFDGRVYVPDAGTGTIKVFEPMLDPVKPKQTITGAETPQKRFVSLVDASVAIDFTNGHLLVIDNLKPGFEHPEGAIDEFDSKGAFISQLKDKVIDGGPSGLAVDPIEGILFATSGNSEGANVFAWSAFGEGGTEAVEGMEEAPGIPGAGASGGGAVGEAVAVGPSLLTRPDSAAAQRRRARMRARHRHARRAHRKMKNRRALGLTPSSAGTR